MSEGEKIILIGAVALLAWLYFKAKPMNAAGSYSMGDSSLPAYLNYNVPTGFVTGDMTQVPNLQATSSSNPTAGGYGLLGTYF
jgi:hypothetical protein